MADKPLFNLDAEGRWRLAYDRNQWVLQKRAGSPGRNRYGIRESGWRGDSFVGGGKLDGARVEFDGQVEIAGQPQAAPPHLPSAG